MVKWYHSGLQNRFCGFESYYPCQQPTIQLKYLRLCGWLSEFRRAKLPTASISTYGAKIKALPVGSALILGFGDYVASLRKRFNILG